jgi:dTDP-4-dehydrorhamnose reductase
MILVVGASSQLGKEFCEYLRSEGIPFVGKSSGELDITVLDDVAEVVGRYNVDVIVNCAAYTNVDQSEVESRKAFDTNSYGVLNLSYVASLYDIELLHFSTDYVFDGKSDGSYSEVDLANPLSVYGRSKSDGEEVATLCDKSYVVRVSNLFGSHGDNFISKVTRRVLHSRELVGVVDDQISSPTYTYDAVVASMKLLASKKYGVYHLTNSGHCSRYDLAEYALGRIGLGGRIYPTKTDNDSGRATRPLRTVLCSDKLYQVIGYQLPEWRDAVDRYLSQVADVELKVKA